MRWSRAGALSLIALLACTSYDRVVVEPRPKTRSFVVLWYEAAGPIHATAFDGKDFQLLVPGNGEEVVILEYDLPLAELQIDPGPIEQDAGGRPLPPADRILHREGGEDFSEVMEPPARVSELSIAPFDPARCLALDEKECVVERLGSPACGACEAVTPMNPVSVDGPAPPVHPRFAACPSGWISANGPAGIAICVPNDPPRLSCSDVEAQFFGEASCERVGRPCPSGRFHDFGPGAIYVDPAAPPGGDGSLGFPFRSIEQALNTASAPGTIGLAADTYQENALIVPEGFTIAGACAETLIRTPSIRLMGEGASILTATIDAMEIAIAGPGALVSTIVRSTSGPTRIVVDGSEQAIFDRLVLRGAGAIVEARSVLTAGDLVADAGCFSMLVTSNVDMAGAVVDVRECAPGGIGGIRVESSGLFGLSRARLADGIEVARGGWIRAVDVAISVSDPFGIQPGLRLDGADAILEHVAIDAPEGVAIDASDGTITGSQVVLRNSLFGVQASASELRFTELAIECGASGFGIWATEQSNVDVSDFTAEGCVTGLSTFDSEALLDRTSLAGVAAGAIAEGGRLLIGNATIRDVEFGVVGQGKGEEITMLRAAIEQIRATGIQLAWREGETPQNQCGNGGPSFGEILLSHIAIRDAVHGIEINRATRAGLGRVSIANAEQGLLFCATDQLTVEHLTVEGATRALTIESLNPALAPPVLTIASVRNGGDGPLIRTLSGALIQDLFVEATEGPALEVIDNRRVSVSRIRADRTQGMKLTAPTVTVADAAILSTNPGGTAVDVEAGRFEIQRFHLRRGPTAIRIRRPNESVIQDGEIQAYDVGIEYPGQGPILRNTRFIDVAEPLVRCPGNGC